MLKKFFKPRAWVQFVHLWVSLIVGLGIVVLVFTGSLLMFRPELEPLLYSNLYKVSSGQPVPLTKILETIKSVYPNYEVDALELPTMTKGAIRAAVIAKSDESDGKVFIDPNSGKINGFQAENSSLFDLLLAFHKRFLINANAPQPQSNYGNTAVGMVGMVFLFLLLTGLVLWFPKLTAWKNAFQLRRKNAFVWNYDSHKLIGIVVLVPLIASISIILPSAVYKQAHEWMDAVSFPRAPDPVRKFSFASGQPADLDAQVKIAENFEAGARAVRVKLGSLNIVRLSTVNDTSRDTGKYQGDLELSISENSGAIVTVRDTRTWGLLARAVDSSLYMGVHAGTWGGWVTRLMMFLVALGAIYLAWSGTRQWWLKRGLCLAARKKAIM